MKVLKVIHGFPPDYMAGSEVYSYHLVKALSQELTDISVFTGVENEFDPAYTTYDEKYDGIQVHRINKPRRDYAYQQKFHDVNIEQAFRKHLDHVKPDVVHFGHLSHLSTQLVAIAKTEYQLPIVFTVHDFWLFCVKGQLINQHQQRCDGASPNKCHACSPYPTTVESVRDTLLSMQDVVSLIDVFLVPSHTLRNFYLQQGVPEDKVIYSKYGFDKDKITYRTKVFHDKSVLNFGFLGRVIPVKGIQTLIEAFKGIDAQLSIYGKVGSQSRFLARDNIHFKGAYDNNHINQVFDAIDVLIVPSTWLENSPLVIQEAFLAGVPVITANIGGMKELVVDGVNGFLFEVGDVESLKTCVLKLKNNPLLLNSLTVSRDSVRDIKDDAVFVKKMYKKVCNIA